MGENGLRAPFLLRSRLTEDAMDEGIVLEKLVRQGRPKGSGDGRTVEIRSISMTPEAWHLLDQMRGASSRGVWISSAVFALTTVMRRS